MPQVLGRLLCVWIFGGGVLLGVGRLLPAAAAAPPFEAAPHLEDSRYLIFGADSLGGPLQVLGERLCGIIARKKPPVAAPFVCAALPLSPRQSPLEALAQQAIDIAFVNIPTLKAAEAAEAEAAAPKGPAAASAFLRPPYLLTGLKNHYLVVVMHPPAKAAAGGLGVDPFLHDYVFEDGRLRKSLRQFTVRESDLLDLQSLFCRGQLDKLIVLAAAGDSYLASFGQECPIRLMENPLSLVGLWADRLFVRDLKAEFFPHQDRPMVTTALPLLVLTSSQLRLSKAAAVMEALHRSFPPDDFLSPQELFTQKIRLEIYPLNP